MRRTGKGGRTDASGLASISKLVPLRVLTLSFISPDASSVRTLSPSSRWLTPLRGGEEGFVTSPWGWGFDLAKTTRAHGEAKFIGEKISEGRSRLEERNQRVALGIELGTLAVPWGRDEWTPGSVKGAGEWIGRQAEWWRGGGRI